MTTKAVTKFFNLRHLLIILAVVTTAFVFQNCSPNSNLNSQAEIGNSNNQNNSNQQGNVAQNVSIVDNTQMQTSSLNYQDYSLQNQGRFSLSLNSDTATNLNTGRSCLISASQSWATMKKLLMEKGICKYTYPIEENQVRCMAFPMPYAQLILSDLRQQDSMPIDLSGSICQTDHNEVCGTDNAKVFRDQFSQLKAEIAANPNCN